MKTRRLIPGLRRRRPASARRFELERLEVRSLLAVDLQLIDFTTPTTAVVGSGQEEHIAWTVQNVGEDATDAPFWFDSVYLSDDDVFDPLTDELQYFTVADQSIEPDGTYSFEFEWAVPNTAPGNRHLLFVIDDGDAQAESDEANNIVAVPIELTAPDVDLTIDFAAPTVATVVAGQPFQLSWTVSNSGSDAAAAPRTDRVYLSTDDFFDFGDTVLYEEVRTDGVGPLGFASGSALVTPDAGLPTGTYYIFLGVDDQGDQYETLDFNNGVAVAIEIVDAGPDLVVESVDAEPVWTVGGSFDVDYTILNQGSTDAAGSLAIGFYLSTDELLSDDDVLVGSDDASGELPLGVGGDFARTQSVNLSAGPLGAVFLLVVADDGRGVSEEDELNNVFVRPVFVEGPAFTDLAVSDLTAPSPALLGGTIDVSYTVTNNGTTAIDAPWVDRFFLSDDAVLDASDVQIDPTDFAGSSPLDPSESVLVERTVQFAVGSVGPGQFLLVQVGIGLTDDDGSNNVAAFQLDVVAPDRDVTAFTAPTSASVNEIIDVSWTVTNIGSAAIAGDWQDRVYLSSDAVLSEFDTLLHLESISRPAGLAPGADYTVNRSFAIPDIAAGEYYLFVRTAAVGQGDLFPANDVELVGPITVGRPDLVIDQFDFPAAAVSGQTISVTYTVLNDSDVPMGAGAISDRIVLSDDEVIDLEDTFLTVIFIQGDTLPLAAHGSYQRTVNVTLPGGVLGSKFLILRTDTFVTQGETNEANNTLALPLTLTEGVDLEVASIDLPVAPVFGEELEISYTVRNVGGATTTAATLRDRVFLTNELRTINLLLSNADVVLDEPLAPGEEYTRSIVVTIPTFYPVGLYRIGVETDVFHQQGESNESNNSLDSELFQIVLPPLPDLVATDLVAPPDGVFSGESVEVSFTVTNQGGADTQVPVWSDYVFISTDPNVTYPNPGPIGTDDGLIANQAFRPIKIANPSYLAVGESYTQTLELTLPIDAVGAWYLYVFPNGIGARFPPHTLTEIDRVNNLARSDAFQVNLTPPPDLVVPQVIASLNVFSGQPANVEWTVTNAGPGATVATSWVDSVYLSTDDILDAGDILLQTANGASAFVHSGRLQSGDSYVNARALIVPDGISGPRFFLVKTDELGLVFEAGVEGNNVGTRATEVLLTPPPDLEVDVVTTSSTGLAGQPIGVSYTVTNRGSTDTRPTSSLDRIYLSADDQLDAGDALLADIWGFTSVLAVDQSYSKTLNVTLPNGIAGEYFVLVAANANQTVFELDRANNVRAGDAIAIESFPPNLQVTYVSTDATGDAGQIANVTWTTKNVGDGPTAATRWLDKLYLSTNGASTGGRLLGAYLHEGVLGADQSYSRVVGVQIPFDVEGLVHLYVVTDAAVANVEATPQLPSTGPAGSVFEGAEGDNTSSLAPIAVARLAPDLVVAEVLAPAGALSGETIVVSWTVENFGGLTNANHWIDDAFLSLDQAVSADDVFLGSVFHLGALDEGGSYGASLTAKLPDSLAGGGYFILVQTDRALPRDPTDSLANRVLEGDFENNNVGAAALDVDLADVPDLAVSQVDLPESTVAGRSLQVSWTVANPGAATGNRSWRDAVYLSLDQVFNPVTDRFIGFVLHAGGLGHDESYLGTGSFNLPGGFTGPYYVFVRTDSADAIFERGSEANNVAQGPESIEILLGQPVDFVIGSIEAPPTATVGLTATIGYSVANNLALPVPGGWTDSIFLSADDVWDTSDVLFATVHRTTDLAPGVGYSESVTAALPILAPGNYRVIVRTDVLNNVAEVDDTNNLGVSLDVAAVDATALTLGTERTDILSEGAFLLYRVEVPAGQTLRFEWNSFNDQASTELYVRFGQPPTRSQFDFRSALPFDADHEIFVPNSRAGTYFVLVRSSHLQAAGTVLVESLPFSIATVTPEAASNAGAATIEIDGAQFTRGTTFELVAPDGAVIGATLTLVVNSTKAYATFDLTGRPAGAYDLVARATGGAVATASDAVQVFDSLLGGVLATGINVPSLALANRQDTFFITYANTGQSDIPAPLLSVRSPTGTLFGRNAPAIGAGDMLMLYGAVPDGPAGVLRAGQSISIPLVFLVPPGFGTAFSFEVGSFGADDTTPIDWTTIEQIMNPDVLAAADYPTIKAQLVSQIGTTMGDYVRMLSRNANLASDFETARDDGALLSYEVAHAVAAVRTSLSGRVVSDDLDVDISDRYVAATNLTTGELFVGSALGDGSFVFETLSPGEYSFEVEGAIVTPGQTALVADGQHATGFQLEVVRGRRLTGRVLAGLAGVADARLSVVAEDGSTAIGSTDALGNFVLSGLTTGVYSLVVEADGFARFNQSGIDLSTGDAVTTIGFSAQAIILGSVSLAAGGPTDTPMDLFATPVAPDPDIGVFGATTLGTTFQIDGLPAGTYDLRIERPGYVSVTLAGVVIGPGQTLNLGTIALQRTAVITGQVISSDPDAPAASAVVAASDATGVVATTIADENGQFAFADLPAGTYDLSIFNLSGLIDAPTVTVVAGEEVEANIVVHVGATILGTVTTAGDASPVAGAWVFLQPPSGAMLSAQTDASGVYRFDGLGLGDYDVFLALGGELSLQSTTVTEIDGQLAEVDLVVEAVANVSGQLRTAAGEPAVGGLVALQQDGRTIEVAIADEQGFYRFLFLQAGSFELIAVAENASFLASGPIAVNVGDSLVRDFVAGEVEVAVHATVAGQPAAGAIATLVRQTVAGPFVLAVLELDENGEASFINLTDGDYEVLVSDQSGRNAKAALSLADGQFENVNLALAIQRVVQGAVTAPSGAAIAGATVLVIDPVTDRIVASAFTAADGSYSFSQLASAAYDFVAYAEGRLASVQSHLVVAGQQTLDFTLSASSTQIVVHVVDAQGHGLLDAYVVARDSAGRVIGEAYADSLGAATITSASGANLQVSASIGGHTRAPVDGVDATAAGTIDLGTLVLDAVAIGVDPSVQIGALLRSANVELDGISASRSAAALAASGKLWPDVIKEDLEKKTLEWKKIEEELSKLPFYECPECKDAYYAALQAYFEFGQTVNKAIAGGKEAIKKAEEFVEKAKAIEEDALKSARQILASADSLRQHIKAGLMEGTGILGSQAIGFVQQMIRGARIALSGIPHLHEATSVGEANDADTPVFDGKNIAEDAVDGLKKLLLSRQVRVPGDLAQVGAAAEALSEAIQRYSPYDADRGEKKFRALSQDVTDAELHAKRERGHYFKCLDEQRNCDNNFSILPLPSFIDMGFTGRRVDPNDIVGPAGYADPRFVTADAPLDYTIHFENLETATLPVQRLTVSTQLDADLDFRTIRFGSFGFGEVSVQVSDARPFLNQRLDLTASLGFYVDVVASIDVTTGVATWSMTAIDPATGLEPRDERIGFLPPNDADGIGEGFVTYSVRAKSSAVSGAAIDAQATIVFDTEEPLDTPTWSNTLDVEAPASQVEALPSTTALSNFFVRWSTGDAPAGSGVASTAIYVSQDGGPYQLWLEAADPVGEALFLGEHGSRYRFLSVASDNAGNRERPPSEPDALTRVVSTPPSIAVAGPAKAIVGQPVEFDFTIADYKANTSSGYTIQIDWNNDGQADAFLVKPSGAVVSHAFSAQGQQSYRWQLVDDGAVVAETTGTIDIQPFDLTGPSETGVFDLVWGGTDADDRYRFEEVDGTTIRVLTLAPDGGVVDTETIPGVTGIVRVFTGRGNDFVDASTLTRPVFVDGGDGNDTILTGAGDDTIDGDGAEGRGNDLIDGGDGDDSIRADGAEGYDTTDAFGHDTIWGGDGDDTIRADGAEGSNDDLIDGGDGDDAIYADGAEGFYEGSSSGQDTITGGSGDDFIVADGAEGAADNITGDGGNDVILAGGGDDVVSGGADADIIVGGDGADHLQGDAGSDLLVAGVVFDVDDASWQLVRAEWTSSRTVSQRADNIRGVGAPPRENAEVFLTTANTQLSEQAIDTLIGGEDEDWLLFDDQEDEAPDFDPLQDIDAPLVAPSPN